MQKILQTLWIPSDDTWNCEALFKIGIPAISNKARLDSGELMSYQRRPKKAKLSESKLRI